MTISSSTRKAGPFSGTGTTGPFTFAFKVFVAADLYVVKLDTITQIETALELTTDYTVSLNADQNAHPGGTITLISALASGYNLVITSTVDYTQETDLTNQGGFYPSVITNALDKLTILTQQLEEANLRSVKVPITSSVPATDYLTEMESIKSATTAVYGDTVAVRDATSAIYDQFNNTYLGAKATDPTLDNIGNALTAGDFYFNTATKVFRYYSGASWYDAMTSGVPVVDVFSGTGSQTAFTLTQAPFHKNTLAVFISGVAQQHSSYSISGTTLTFTTAPPSGSSNIEVVQPGYLGVNVPVDGSVTSSKIASGVTISGPTISDPTITGTSTVNGSFTVSGQTQVTHSNASLTSQMNVHSNSASFQTDDASGYGSVGTQVGGGAFIGSGVDAGVGFTSSIITNPNGNINITGITNAEHVNFSGNLSTANTADTTVSFDHSNGSSTSHMGSMPYFTGHFTGNGTTIRAGARAQLFSGSYYAALYYTGDNTTTYNQVVTESTGITLHANSSTASSVSIKSDKLLVLNKSAAIATAPATATSTGTTGEVRFCSDGIYVCIATNTWRKAALSTF